MDTKQELILEMAANTNMTDERARELAHSNWYMNMSPLEAAMLQMLQEKLCMPSIDEFQKVTEMALGREISANRIPCHKLLVEIAVKILHQKSRGQFYEVAKSVVALSQQYIQ